MVNKEIVPTTIISISGHNNNNSSKKDKALNLLTITRDTNALYKENTFRIKRYGDEKTTTT